MAKKHKSLLPKRCQPTQDTASAPQMEQRIGQFRRHYKMLPATGSVSGAFGAGSGNRPRVFSLEGCCSTIELYPQLPFVAPGRQWWRRLDSNQRRLSQRIYSPSPLTTRALLRTALPEPCNEAFDRFRNREKSRSSICDALMATRSDTVNRAIGNFDNLSHSFRRWHIQRLTPRL